MTVLQFFSIYYFFDQSQWSKLQGYSLIERLLQGIRVPTALEYKVRFHERAEVAAQISHSGL